MRQVLFTEPRQFAPRGKGLIDETGSVYRAEIVCPSWEGINHTSCGRLAVCSGLPLVGGDDSTSLSESLS